MPVEHDSGSPAKNADNYKEKKLQEQRVVRAWILQVKPVELRHKLYAWLAKEFPQYHRSSDKLQKDIKTSL